MISRIKQICSGYAEKLIEYRRYLHQHPELSFKEENTSAWIRTKLAELEIPMEENIRGNSVVGVIDSGVPGPTIAFRADIDALAIQEDNGLEYSSKNPNVMHACGHDMHTATLLCLADAMVNNKELLKGRVKLIFQQGEELPPGGAIQLCEDGVMNDVDKIFAYHVGGAQVGEIIIGSGVRTSAIATYEIELEGIGGHGGFPFMAANPIVAASELLNQIYKIVPLHVDTKAPALITVAYLLSNPAKASNIIPNQAIMGGNIRTFDNALLDEIIDWLTKITEGVEKSTGVKCSLSAQKSYLAVVNTDEETKMVMDATKALGYELFIPPGPSMAGEDFSHYLLEKPGAYFSVGINDYTKNTNPAPVHNPKFVPEEKGMEIALEVLLATYFEALGENL